MTAEAATVGDESAMEGAVMVIMLGGRWRWWGGNGGRDGNGGGGDGGGGDGDGGG